MFYRVDKNLVNLVDSVDLVFWNVDRANLIISSQGKPIDISLTHVIDPKSLMAEITKIAKDFELSKITTTDNKIYFIDLNNIYHITTDLLTFRNSISLSLSETLRTIKNLSNSQQIMESIIANQEKEIINNDLNENDNKQPKTSSKKPRV